MDFTFTSTEETTAGRVPFYEDARADFAPYYASGKSVKVAKQEMAGELSKLCLLYTTPHPPDRHKSPIPLSA